MRRSEMEMSREIRRVLNRWLAAERSGGDDAERQLRALFLALPEPRPSAGFARRVLAGAGLLPMASYGWRTRLAIGFSLLLCGLASGSLLPLALHLLAAAEPASLIAALVQALAAPFRGIDELMLAGRLVSGFGRALWLVVTSPPVLLGLSVVTTVTFFALRRLLALLSIHRSPAHAYVR